MAPAIDFMPLATLVADGSGAVMAVNRAWLKLSGLDEDESRGEGWLSRFAPAARPRVMRTVRRVAESGGLESAEHEIDTPARARWTRWTFRRHDCDGRQVVVMVVVDLDVEHALQVDLRHRATHDALTGLLNRAEFLQMTARAMARGAGRTGIIYLDLDRFKQVNDEGGHQTGDQVLAAVALRLRAAVRPADVVGRVGGDEFAVLCQDLPQTEDLERVAGRLRAVLKAPLEANGTLHTIGATTGVAVAAPGSTPEELLDAADRAMYAAKFRRHRAPAPAEAETSSEKPGQSRGRRVIGAPPPAVPPGRPEGLVEHLYTARINLESCAAAATNGPMEDLWAAIDEVDTVLALLRAPGPAAGSARPVAP